MEAAQAVDRAFAFYWYAQQHPEVLAHIPDGAVVLWMDARTSLGELHDAVQKAIAQHDGAPVIVVIHRDDAERRPEPPSRPLSLQMLAV